jgi:hypothetical protein
MIRRAAVHIAKSVLLLVFLAMVIGTAHADAIDGEWCFSDGRRMRIEGPKITTPAGIETRGEYHRHSFAYEGPVGDPEAGQVILMELLNEEEVRLTRVKSGQPSPHQIWRRCQVTS